MVIFLCASCEASQAMLLLLGGRPVSHVLEQKMPVAIHPNFSFPKVPLSHVHVHGIGSELAIKQVD